MFPGLTKSIPFIFPSPSCHLDLYLQTVQNENDDTGLLSLFVLLVFPNLIILNSGGVFQTHKQRWNISFVQCYQLGVILKFTLTFEAYAFMFLGGEGLLPGTPTIHIRVPVFKSQLLHFWPSFLFMPSFGSTRKCFNYLSSCHWNRSGFTSRLLALV